MKQPKFIPCPCQPWEPIPPRQTFIKRNIINSEYIQESRDFTYQEVLKLFEEAKDSNYKIYFNLGSYSDSNDLTIEIFEECEIPMPGLKDLEKKNIKKI